MQGLKPLFLLAKTFKIFNDHLANQGANRPIVSGSMLKLTRIPPAKVIKDAGIKADEAATD